MHTYRMVEKGAGKELTKNKINGETRLTTLNVKTKTSEREDVADCRRQRAARVHAATDDSWSSERVMAVK